VFTAAALGREMSVAEPHGSALEYYLVRDIDALPGVFSATELMQGAKAVHPIRRVPVEGRP